GDDVPSLGYPSVYYGTKGAFGVQRIQVHFHGHLQRVPSLSLPQCIHVSTWHSC
ncbi:hypothetical protein SK128_012092, partial [Halocaridina rubra]